MKKLLSIIVPSYNMEAYLPKCLGSLIVDDSELLQQLDVIVVNDGSKDRTSEIAHEFEAKYPGVFRVIDKPNGHYGSCVNAALTIADGEFVRILDADDYVDSESFQKYVELLESLRAQDSIGVVLTNYDIVDADGLVTERARYDLPVGSAFDVSLALNSRRRIEIQAVTYRRSVFDHINYKQTEGICYTDLEWITYPMAGVENAYFSPLSVIRYLVGRDGQTVALETYARNGEMLIKINRRFVEYYADCGWKSGTAVGAEYVRTMIERHVANVYKARLIEFRCDVKGSIADFDAFLSQTSPELYGKMNDVKAPTRRFDFYCIREWRQKRTRWSLRFILYRWYVAANRLVRTVGMLMR